jgi:hypothetical protein
VIEDGDDRQAALTKVEDMRVVLPAATDPALYTNLHCTLLQGRNAASCRPGALRRSARPCR